MPLNNIALFNLLPFIIQIPILGALCISQMDEKKFLDNIKSVSTWVSAFAFLLISILYLSSDNNLPIKCKFFNFFLSINNLTMIVLEITAFVTMTCILISKKEIVVNVKKFHILLLLLEAFLLTIFSTTSIIVFFVLFELIIVFTFFLIRSFSEKSEPAFKFLFFQLFGSIFIFLGVVYVISVSSMTEIHIISHYIFTYDQECIIFLMFFIGFAILSAIFPFHSWFSDVHTHSPTPISIFLSGMFSVISVFGFITILMPITKKAFFMFQEYVLYLPIITMIYATITSSKQDDLKKIVSYVSLIHTSIIAIGIFSCNVNGITGAFFNTLSHSLVIPMMYIVISVMENTFGTRSINGLSNTSISFPSLMAIALVPMLSALFVPLFPCFSGFILILFSYFRDYFFSVIMICLVALCGTFYTLQSCGRAFFSEEFLQQKHTLKKDELIYLVPVLLAIIAISIFQKNIISVISSSLLEIVPKKILAEEFSNDL